MSEAYQNRQYTIRLVFILSALVLTGYAMYLQVFNNTYKVQADAAAINRLSYYPSRGVIYDRHGELLVYNEPMYDLMVTYNQISPKMDTAKFCRLLDISEAYFTETLNKNWKSGRFSKSVPFVFLSKISPKIFARFQESLYQFPGFTIQLRHARGYPHANAAHVLGYIREVNAEEVEKNKIVYEPGDYIGANGLEKSYEPILRGTKGVRYVLKDNLGREVGSYKDGAQDTIPVSGHDLITTIDLELQQYGEALMKNKRGGIIAIDPQKGEVLAMISTPAYDPKKLVISNDRGKSFKELQTDKEKPLFNRAILAQYPPGSLFKPIVALIALQEGVIQPNKTVSCGGAYFLNGQRLTGCHGHPTCTNVKAAIQYSCNAYFVTVFREIVDKDGFYHPEKGLDVFNQYLDKFGMGKKLGIDFPGEQKGHFPTSDYYNKWYKGQRWNSVWIRSLGIGQGELLLTNLQMANLAAIIANRGYYITPHLVRAYLDGDEEITPKEFQEKHSVDIDPEYFELVVDGMEAVVTSGTARSAYIPDIAVCGKTGTAENPHGKDHSIFFAFAPKHDPKIAIAVYIENAGFGGTYAAPIASLMIEKYIRRSIIDQRKWLEQRMLEANLTETTP